MKKMERGLRASLAGLLATALLAGPVVAFAAPLDNADTVLTGAMNNQTNRMNYTIPADAGKTVVVDGTELEYAMLYDQLWSDVPYVPGFTVAGQMEIQNNSPYQYRVTGYKVYAFSPRDTEGTT